MGLISVADLTARKVEFTDSAQAQAAIDDASAVARACVSPLLDTVEAPAAPAAVVAVVVGMVRRVLANPRGLAQETLGDYAYATGTAAVATLLPTLRERRLLRAAAVTYARATAPAGTKPVLPPWGADGMFMQTELPTGPRDDGIRLP